MTHVSDLPSDVREPDATAPAGQSTPSAPSVTVASRVLRRLDAILALMAVVVIASFRLLDARSVVLPIINLDDSWRIDLAYRFSRGNWLGKDFFFTYGPLFEFMLGLPARALHQSDIGFIYRTWSVIPIAVSILLVYGISALLMGSEPAWKRLLFLFIMIYFWCPFDARPIMVVFIFATLIRAITSLDVQTVLPKAAVAASLVIAAFLVSADTGIYSAAVVVMVGSCAFFFEPQRRRALVLFFLGASSLIAAGVLLVNRLLGSWLRFSLWRGAFEEAGNYRWAVPLGLRPGMAWFILFVVMATVLAVVAAWIFRQKQPAVLTRRPIFICAGFFLSLLCLQSALVRSDWTHVVPAAFPAIAVIGFVLLGTGAVKRGPAVGLACLALGASVAVAAIPSHHSWAYRLLSNQWALRRATGECPSGTRYYQQACVSDPQFAVLRGAEEFFQSSADAKVFVFPYENALAVAANKLDAGGVLQSYAAHGNFLTNEHLASLHRDRPELAIYGVDGVTSWQMDDVSNLSRSPGVWFFLQQNYRYDSALPFGFVGLRRDDARSKHWKEDRESSRDFRPRVVKVSGAGTYDLGNVGWNGPYDFIRLELRLAYPMWWKVSKPAAIAVLLHFSDGSVKTARGIFPPNQETEFCVYPWDETQLWRYFLPDPRQWRAVEPRPAITSLEIKVSPFDAISILPSVIQVSKAEAVSITLQ